MQVWIMKDLSLSIKIANINKFNIKQGWYYSEVRHYPQAQNIMEHKKFTSQDKQYFDQDLQNLKLMQKNP